MELIFGGLFASHLIILYVGWRMGQQRGPEYYVPPAKAEKSEPFDPVDEIDKERLDWK